VIADIDLQAAEIVLVVHWIGGIHAEIRLPKRRRENRRSASADLIAAVRQLVLIANDDLMAGSLNRNGLVTDHGNRWTRERVTALRSHHRSLSWGRAVAQPHSSLAGRSLDLQPRHSRVATSTRDYRACAAERETPHGITSRSGKSLPSTT
jgi:hypothetical protein